MISSVSSLCHHKGRNLRQRRLISKHWHHKVKNLHERRLWVSLWCHKGEEPPCAEVLSNRRENSERVLECSRTFYTMMSSSCRLAWLLLNGQRSVHRLRGWQPDSEAEAFPQTSQLLWMGRCCHNTNLAPWPWQRSMYQARRLAPQP